MKTELVGEVHDFNLNGHNRLYMVKTLPYGTVKEIVKADRYSAETGDGEQREVWPAHSKELKKAIVNGTFTPTPIAVGVREKDRKDKISITDGQAVVQLDDGDTLPLLDAGHRLDALENLFKSSTDDKLKQQILSLPITAMVYLDGDTKQDFLNLQCGRTVDRAHMMSLKVQTSLFKKNDVPLFKMAMDIARYLATAEGSPFYNQVRFDSRGASGIPINTLCSKGASDLGTSLVGSAKLAIKGGKDAKWAADVIIQTFKTLKDKAPDLLASGRVLCPPPYGTRGASTMLVGIGNIMMYRLLSLKRDEVSDEDRKALIDACQSRLSSLVDGNFSGPAKRKLLGDFVYEFLALLSEPEHESVPIGLIQILSSSTFGVSKLPKVAKQKAAPKKKKNGGEATEQEEGEEEDDIDFIDDTAPDDTDDPEGPSSAELDIEDPDKAPWESEG